MGESSRADARSYVHQRWALPGGLTLELTVTGDRAFTADELAAVGDIVQRVEEVADR